MAAELTRLPRRDSVLSLISERARGWGWLTLPGVAFLAVVFGWPLADMAIRSFTDPSPHNYAIFTESSIYRSTYVTTFRIAAITTVTCLLLGYPYAYLMHISGRRAAMLLGFFVLLPFWSNTLVRTYAWTIWLQDTGIINTALQNVGLTHHPLTLMRNDVGVTIGMTYVMLPFMVLSLYAGMRRIDPDLVKAAESLGATPASAFRRVFVPLSKSGIYAGCLIVFVISLGFYLTPAILGDPTHPLVGQTIVEQVNHQLQFGIGSALGLVLLVLTLLVVWLGTRLVNFRTVAGYEE